MRRYLAACILALPIVFLPVCLAQSGTQLPQMPQTRQSTASPPGVLAAPVPPVRDSQALAILSQCVNSIGGASAVGGLQDYTGTGNITYFWAGKQVNGSLKVQGTTTNQFRLDSMLPQGTRSWVINGGDGKIKEPDGKESTIPTYNGLALGSLTLPHSLLLNALKDSSVTVTSLGQQTFAGTQVTRVRIQPNFPPELDPNGDWARWSTREYLIDISSFQVVGTRAILHSNDSSARPFTEEITFSNYQQVNGIVVPFSIVETINGQKTWAIQLNAIKFNTGLTNATFHM